MPGKDSLHRLAVSSPCSQDWDSMTGNDRVRFCEHCSLHVHNISEMTRAKALRLVESSHGGICVRYYRDTKGGVISGSVSPRLHQLGRRVSRVAAGAFSATLSLSAAVAQSPSGPQPGPHSIVQSADRWALGAAIVGTVTEPNGGVVAGVSVSLIGMGTNFFTSTNDSGEFRFEGLASGTYKMSFQAPGFTIDESSLYLEQNGEKRVNQQLRVSNVGTSENIRFREFTDVVMGGMGVATPTHPFVKAAFEDNLEELSRLLPEIDVNVRDETTGTTALDQAVESGNREMVELLLSRGANVNARDESGRTALMLVDDEATSDLVWDLLNAGAEVNAKTDRGRTPLISAAYYNNVEVLKALLDAGAEVNSKDEDGETALTVAADTGQLQNVRALVLAGARLDQENAEGKNALSIAVENGHWSIIRFLRSKGALESAAQVAAQK